jgi:hypothetical protein
VLIQVAVVGKSSMKSSSDRILYTFLALMFFGSLWFSWQVECANTRNIVPYLPFLAVMLAMAFRFWVGEAGRRRAATVK